MSNYYNLPTDILENDYLRLEYLVSAGPRIVRFSLQDKPNLLAELPDFFIETRLGPFYFRGGHRLWRSPELMPETYAPDNEGLIVEKYDNGVILSQPLKAGISKSIEIRMVPDRASVTLVHHLCNTGTGSVTLAPWALTMFRLGGVGIFPQATEKSDSLGLLPNRQLVLWPYTRICDKRLTLADDFILLQAAPELQPVKFGYLNPHGWMGYYLDKMLFIKRFTPLLALPYPDYGCNCETFCNNQLVELETVGALTELQPGAEVIHTETWEVYESLDQPFISEKLREQLLS